MTQKNEMSARALEMKELEMVNGGSDLGFDLGPNDGFISPGIGYPRL